MDYFESLQILQLSLQISKPLLPLFKILCKHTLSIELNMNASFTHTPDMLSGEQVQVHCTWSSSQRTKQAKSFKFCCS